jgi:hypothetical protein
MKAETGQSLCPKEAAKNCVELKELKLGREHCRFLLCFNEKNCFLSFATHKNMAFKKNIFYVLLLL